MQADHYSLICSNCKWSTVESPLTQLKALFCASYNVHLYEIKSWNTTATPIDSGRYWKR